MKTIFTAIVLLLSVSTFAQKTTEELSTQKPTKPYTTVTTTETIPAEGTAIMGTVVSNKQCPAYIVATINGQSVNVYPTNLATEFAVDGMQIKFDYKVKENILLPEGCDLKAAVELSNVKKSKFKG